MAFFSSWGQDQPVIALGCMFLLFMSQGACALDDQRAERGFANKLISFHNLTVVFLHQYCCVSLRHVTPSVFKYCPLSLGNTGINRELVEMQNLGGLPHTPSSVCFVVLQYPLLCLP